MSQQDQTAAFNAYSVSNSNQPPIAELAYPNEDSHLSYTPDADEESHFAEEYSDLESDSDDDDQLADWKDKGPSDPPMGARPPRQQAARLPTASNASTQAPGRRGVNNTSGSSSRAGGNGHASQNQGRSAPTGKAN